MNAIVRKCPDRNCRHKHSNLCNTLHRNKKPRIKWVPETLSMNAHFICSGWLPNNFQHLSAPGRTQFEAWEMFKLCYQIYKG